MFADPRHTSSRRALCALTIALLALGTGCATGELDPDGDGVVVLEDMSAVDMNPSGEEMDMADMLAVEMGPEDMPSDMPAPQDMPVDMSGDMDPEEDMPDMTDMFDPEDMMDMTPPDMGPCDGMCGATEECRQGVCVDLCAEQSAQCGEVTSPDGMLAACGSCMGGTSCIDNVCVDACAQANNTCGDFVWSGQDVSCATGCTGGKTCFMNTCASSGWRQVVAGKKHSCASRSDGTVRCWGDNQNGQLGTLQAGNSSSSPVVLTGLTGIRQLSSTDRHTCALDTNDRLWCWGYNNHGQVGDEQPNDARRTPYRHPTAMGVDEVGVGTFHTCIRLSTGFVECVGFNSQGQLGNGSSNASYVFSESKNLTDAIDISVGVAHSCALERDGEGHCWGLNGTTENFGRLGTGTTPSRTAPTRVVQLSGIRQIASGQDHTCAITQSGEVWCWGDNTFGQLGDGGMQDSLTPRKANGLSNAVAISAGADHTCAIDASRRAHCWGRNDFGQLGLGHRNPQRSPQQINSLAEVLSIDGGFDHTCATTAGGLLFCWGRNDIGQLGQGDLVDSTTPKSVN